jgi:pyridoxamine 5'-phosphate oxidase
MDILLQDIFNKSWQKLNAAVNGNEPHYRNVTVCNSSAGYINAYTVVLREVYLDTSELLFYTDVRSEKVDEIRLHKQVTVLVYSDDEKIQLVMRGNAAVHHQDETTLACWTTNGYRSRRSYMAHPAPSTPVTQPTDGLENTSPQKLPAEDFTGYENFAVINLQIFYLEFLHLNPQGNRRARFTLAGGVWDGTWVIP